MAKLHAPDGQHERRQDGSDRAICATGRRAERCERNSHRSEPRIFVDSVTRSLTIRHHQKFALIAGPSPVASPCSVDLGAAPCPRAPELGPDPCLSPPALRVFRAKRRRACAANRYLWPANIMDGLVRERLPPGDEKESPGEEKPEEKPDDEKPDESEQPPFRPSKQDPFYLGLCLDLRKARRAARGR